MDALVDFLKRFSWPFGLTAGLYVFVTRFTPTIQIDLNLYLSIIFFLLAVVMTLCTYLAERPKVLGEPAIIVEQVRESGRLLLIKKTERLGTNMFAQVFFQDEEFELFVGLGKVINVQNNGMVQLYLVSTPTDSKIATGLTENRPETRKRLIIKPAVIVDGENTEIVDERFV